LWIDAMNAANYLGFHDWRLPATVQPDPGCSTQGNFSGVPKQGFAFGCTASEMGHLFNVDGITSGSPGPFTFTNISTTNPANIFWSGTEFAVFATNAWFVAFSNGTQNENLKSLDFFPWAVRTGNVVPIPAAVWLFGSGLLGLLGLSKRHR